MFQLLKECEGAANIVISGHIRPDGDCVGSCMATYLFLKKTMPKADIRIFLEQPADIFSCIQDFDLIDTTFQMEAEPDVFIALDCEKTRLGEAEKIFDSVAVYQFFMGNGNRDGAVKLLVGNGKWYSSDRPGSR